MRLQFFQIVFKIEQLNELYPFALPHWNEQLTQNFENDVIAQLVPQATGDYVSVCSWALRRKRTGGAAEVILKQTYGTTDLTYENIVDSDADVMILTPVRHTDILTKFYQWHGTAAKEAVKEFNKFIKFPEEVKHSIYENHFVARREIYTEYVETCLRPALEFIGEKEVFKAASGYKEKKIRLTKNNGEVDETLKKFGLPDYPISPFLLERLFSIWINSRDFKVIPR